jgi:vacuolar-type H+-ATPase subunit H
MDEKTTNETDILSEIRNSEAQSEEIIEKAEKKKGVIVQDAVKNSSELLSKTKEDLVKLWENKVLSARDKAKLIKEDKLKEGKKAADQLKKKGEKNVSKAVEFIIEKFEEMI